MTFDLLPTVTYWAAAVAVLALVGLVLVAGLAADFVSRNRPVRLARHESVRRYYGHLALGS